MPLIQMYPTRSHPLRISRTFVRPWRHLLIWIVLVVSVGLPRVMSQENTESARPQTAKKKIKKPLSTHKWVDPANDFLMKQLPKTLKHATFQSPSMKLDVGYYIYFPPQYAMPQNAEMRFPVVYYLHGGRPGSEAKAIRLANQIDSIAQENQLAPVIYVFVNGGPVSHYNLPNQAESQGADVFIKELIPHIDQTYRTISRREGRGIEGFSQGGRGAARLMFRYPDLFCSASPGGGGHATEQRISNSGGFENPKLKFAKGDNTWDLASAYAEKRKNDKETPVVKILVHVGRDGFNYENNLAWMKHLKTLGIEHERLVVLNVGHSARDIYEKQGLKIMKFHTDNFAAAKK